MKQSLYYLNDDETWFPPLRSALSDPPGLLAVGGDLSLQRLKTAYEAGIFPWYSNNEPLLWWSPDPRAIIEVDQIRVNKSLRKFLKKCDYKVTINNCFNDVVAQCALPRSEENGTWIFPEMQQAYSRLHKAGIAHSIEIWQGSTGKLNPDHTKSNEYKLNATKPNQIESGELEHQSLVLVGGLYGVKVGSCFCGESMFSSQPNASKLALLVLGSLLSEYENAFIDCQLPNPYLMAMGAKTISRDMFIQRLFNAKSDHTNPDSFTKQEVDWSSLGII